MNSCWGGEAHVARRWEKLLAHRQQGIEVFSPTACEKLNAPATMEWAWEVSPSRFEPVDPGPAAWLRDREAESPDKLCPDSWPMETVSWKCALFPPAKFWGKLSYIWLERRDKNEFKDHEKEACTWYHRKQQLLLFRYLLLNGWYWLHLNTLNLFKHFHRKVRNMEKFKEKLKIMHNFTTNT